MTALIVHDYLLQEGGAERVVDALAEAFPSAPIATSIASPAYRRRFGDRALVTSYLQRAPVGERTFRALLPAYAHAFSRLALPRAEVAVCSSSGWAHHVAAGASMPVIVYCHTPARWLWRSEEYFAGVPARALHAGLAPLLAELRRIDRRRAREATRYVANSYATAERIAHCYGVEATVVHPPVQVERFRADRPRGERYLVVSRLLGYKRLELAVDACTRLGRPLLVVGDGPALRGLRRRAGRSVEFTGRLPDATVAGLMETCRALIVPGEEDFGIAAVEAMAAGAPVVAFDRGGSRETVIDGRTGVRFGRPTVASLVGALERLEGRSWPPERQRLHAMRFGTGRFVREIRGLVDETLGRRPAEHPAFAAAR